MPQNAQTIALHTVKSIRYVPVELIIRLESINNYTIFFLADKEKITVCATLKHYEEILDPACFVRIHQSHIININRIREYVKGRSGKVIMENGDVIDMSSTRKLQFFKALEQLHVLH